MWLRTVFLVSCIVVCVYGVRDIDIPDDSLQDLLVRSKKSPVIITSKERKEWSKSEEPNIKSLLVEDIRREVEELKELDSVYRKVKSEYLNQKNNESSSDNSELLKAFVDKIPIVTEISDDEAKTDDETIRPVRQHPIYGPYQPHVPPEIYYGAPSSHMASRLYSSNPHLMDGGYPAFRTVQYHPSPRTYGAAGIKAEVDVGHKSEVNHIPPAKTIKQLKQLIPNVINVLSEIVPQPKPEVYAVHEVKKPQVHAVQTPIHHPAPSIELIKKKNKEGKSIGLTVPSVFYSKQILIGGGADKKFGDKHYGSVGPYHGIPINQHGYYPGYSLGYPQGHSYLSPSYSLYPEGGAYISPLYAPYSESYGYGSQAQGHSSPTPTNIQGQEKGYYDIVPEDGSNVNYNAYRNYEDQGQLDEKLNLDQNTQNPSLSENLGAVNKLEEDKSVQELKADIEATQKEVIKLMEDVSDKQKENVDFKNIKKIEEKWKNLEGDINKTKDTIIEDSSKQDLNKEELKKEDMTTGSEIGEKIN